MSSRLLLRKAEYYNEHAVDALSKGFAPWRGERIPQIM
jgi:hypothetical protein